MKSKIVVRVYQYHWAVSHSSILHFLQPNTTNATAKKKLRPGPAHFQGEIITKKRIYIDDIKGIFTKLGRKHPWVKEIQMKNNFIFKKIIMFLSSLIQCYDIAICVIWFELVFSGDRCGTWVSCCYSIFSSLRKKGRKFGVDEEVLVIEVLRRSGDILFWSFKGSGVKWTYRKRIAGDCCFIKFVSTL